MKKSLIYIYTALLALAGSVSLSSCDDDFERPPMVLPTAERHANTTIAELKTKFYKGESNYATLVEKREDGADYIIKGRVISSDQSGNFFKQLVIEDETGAIQVNIDSYDLYESYQYGQEIVIDVTGLYVGAYGKLMQIGSTPSNNYPGRIASDLAAKQIEVDGLSEPEKITIGEYTIGALNDLISNQEEFLAKQCRLVSIKDVTFKDAGKATLAEKDKNTSRTISDGTGDMIVYTSGYSDFYDYYCPEGKGTIVGILSFFNKSWQIRLLAVSEDETLADSMRGLIGYELKKEPSAGGGSDTPSGEAVTSLNENFDAGTEIPAGWFQKQVAGDKTWFVKAFNSNNYISMSGYKGNAPFDQWLISPAIDMDKVADKILTFDTQVNGYGATTTTLKLYVITNLDKLDEAKEVEATFAKAPESGYSEWVNSGNIDLKAFTGKVYLAFRYQATQDANYATWCVDNIKLNAAK